MKNMIIPWAWHGQKWHNTTLFIPLLKDIPSTNPSYLLYVPITYIYFVCKISDQGSHLNCHHLIIQYYAVIHILRGEKRVKLHSITITSLSLSIKMIFPIQILVKCFSLVIYLPLPCLGTGIHQRMKLHCLNDTLSKMLLLRLIQIWKNHSIYPSLQSEMKMCGYPEVKYYRPQYTNLKL